jgi:hypothetical protein
MKNNDVRTYTPPPHLVWEAVGSEVVIHDNTSETSHLLTGDLARSFLAAAEGQPISSQEGMALQQRGLLGPCSPLSRRALITAGGAGLGLGITSLSLPTAAAASSTSPKATITAESLEPGRWRWSASTTALTITQTDGTTFLPNLPVFTGGGQWRLTLADFAGGDALGTIVDLGGGLLELGFSFPLGDSVAAPPAGTVLRGTLTKADDTSVFSEQFPIPQLTGP